jgi:hypothetical protein
LGVLIVGLVWGRHLCIGKRLGFALIVLAVGTAVSIIFHRVDVIVLSNAACYGAVAMLAVQIALAILAWLASIVRRKAARRRGLFSPRPATVATTVFLVALLGAAAANAEPQNPNSDGPPVHIPPEALLVPYELERGEAPTASDRIMVLLDRYAELWDKVHPDDPLRPVKPPAPYALAGANYRAMLQGNGSVKITGEIDIVVYADRRMALPLPLEGSVLTGARLDGRPAMIYSGPPVLRPRAELLMNPQPRKAGPKSGKGQAQQSPQAQAQPQQPQQAEQQQGPQPRQARPKMPNGRPPLPMVQVRGKGRHTLRFTVHMGVTREGGWRILSGRLPAAPASEVTLRVPRPDTELRLTHLPDRSRYRTTESDARIRTALPASGRLQVRWRPHILRGVSEGALKARVERARLDGDRAGRFH